MNDHSNPWCINNLEEFLYFCCPECNSKYQSKETFVMHAFENHPKAKNYLELRLDSGNVKVVCKKLVEQTSTPVKLHEVVIHDVVIMNNDNLNDILIENNEHNTYEETLNLSQNKFIAPKSKTIVKSKNLSKSEEDKISQNTCQICKKVLFDASCARRHIRTVHEGIKSNKCEQKSRYNDDIFDNPFIDKRKIKGVNASSIAQHQSNFCDICNLSFLNSSDLSKHILTKHDAEEHHPCEYCNKTFSSKGGFSLHQE